MSSFYKVKVCMIIKAMITDMLHKARSRDATPQASMLSHIHSFEILAGCIYAR